MTTGTVTPLAPIVGLDVVGRGIYLRPHSPYQLTRLLFPHANVRGFQSKETGESYGVPAGYEVNDSPPMPAQQALGQLMIEESFDRFERQLRVDASLTASNHLFSIDASATQGRRLRTAQEAYYALRSSFIPLWSVYLSDSTRVPQDAFDLSEVTAPFDHDHRRQYDAFFERYGTHFVKRAWIGGTANLAFTVLKSSSMTKAEIQAGVKASFGTFGGSGANTHLLESQEKLQANAEYKVPALDEASGTVVKSGVFLQKTFCDAPAEPERWRVPSSHDHAALAGRSGSGAAVVPPGRRPVEDARGTQARAAHPRTHLTPQS